MFIDVTTLKQLEEVKRLILIKKKPNRKPFPRDSAVYSKCGQRCDLCVHYYGIYFILSEGDCPVYRRKCVADVIVAMLENLRSVFQQMAVFPYVINECLPIFIMDRTFLIFPDSAVHLPIETASPILLCFRGRYRMDFT